MMGIQSDNGATNDTGFARRRQAQSTWSGEGFKRWIGGKHLKFEAIEGSGPDDSGQTIGTPCTADGFRPPEGSISDANAAAGYYRLTPACRSRRRSD